MSESNVTGKQANEQTGRATEPVGSEFRRLVLWQKAQGLAAEVAELVTRLPSDRASGVIASQLLRAATSIAANIAEGYGRYSQAAYRSHLSIARGSAFEVESWLDLLERRGYLPEEAAGGLFDHCQEVQKLLTLRMKSLGEASRTYAREEKADYEV